MCDVTNPESELNNASAWQADEAESDAYEYGEDLEQLEREQEILYLLAQELGEDCDSATA